MTVNPHYHQQCYTSARNCKSGCCDIYRNCALFRNKCQYKYNDYSYNTYYYYRGYAHDFCQLDALNCVSGCCTFTGKCANTSSTCFYQYDNYYSNYSYYFPGDVNTNYNTNTNNNTNSNNYPYYNSYSYNIAYKKATNTLAVSVGVTVGYLVLFIAALIYCYFKRKPFVQAINRFATHDSEGNPIFYDPNLPQPTFGIDPACLQPPTNPTYPGQLQQYHNPSPNKNAVLPLDTSINSLNNSFNRMLQNKQ